MEKNMKVGDLIIARDDLGIVYDTIGKIESIDKAHSGEKVYTCKFDVGTFLLQKKHLNPFKE
jgi:hypothetical protein